MRYFVTVDGEEFEVQLDRGEVHVNGELVSAELSGFSETSMRHLLLDGRSHFFLARRNGEGEWSLDLSAGSARVEVLDRAGRAVREVARRTAAIRGPEPLTAPMPGMVVKVEVEEGEEVAAGQAVAVVEAMKMENELHAAGAGVVSSVRVAPGQAVEKGEVLVEFESLPSEGASRE